VEPGDRARNDLWRRAVGPPVSGDHRQGSDDTADRLTLVSWNLHVGGGDVAEFLHDLRTGVLTGAPVEHFVLLVQETFRAGTGVPVWRNDVRGPSAIHACGVSGARSDVETIARDQGLAFLYVPSMRNGCDAHPLTGMCEDRGNAILSTLPLSSFIAVELSMLHQRRVAVLASVGGRTSDGSRWELQVASVHLDVKSLPRGRTRQAEAIVRVATAPASIIGGDLNVLPWIERAPRVFREAFPDGIEADRRHTHTNALRNKIDYQFYRLTPQMRPLPTVRAHGPYNSDHYPLIGGVLFGDRSV
jgi:endonuclease/exonuclease/phosphatase family metal-dependent hydrolase